VVAPERSVAYHRGGHAGAPLGASHGHLRWAWGPSLDFKIRPQSHEGGLKARNQNPSSSLWLRGGPSVAPPAGHGVHRLKSTSPRRGAPVYARGASARMDPTCMPHGSAPRPYIPLDMEFIARIRVPYPFPCFFSASLWLRGETFFVQARHGVHRSESIHRRARPLQARNGYVRHRSPGGPGVWVAVDFVLFCDS